MEGLQAMSASWHQSCSILSFHQIRADEVFHHHILLAIGMGQQLVPCLSVMPRRAVITLPILPFSRHRYTSRVKFSAKASA